MYLLQSKRTSFYMEIEIENILKTRIDVTPKIIY